MNERELVDLAERIGRELGFQARYHGELDCLGPDLELILTVDLLNNTEGKHEIRLAIFDETDDWDPTGMVDLCPDDARSLAAHLLQATEIATGSAKKKE